MLSLGVGSGAVGAPGELTTDKFNEKESPHPERYPGGNESSMLRLDADIIPWPFFDNQFGAVIMNHSFEHFNDQEAALNEALRVTHSPGYVCILMPDMTFHVRDKIDPTHTTEWAADTFLDWLEKKTWKHVFDVVEHNTLDNSFSFNTTLRKKG